MITHIHSVPIIVADQDRALAFYRDVLGFEVTADDGAGDFRWLTVKPAGGQTHIMLAKASPNLPEMGSRVGKWTGMVLDTDNIQRDCERFQSLGVRITRLPKQEHYGIEAQFADPDGNTIELVEPAHHQGGNDGVATGSHHSRRE